MRLNILYCDRWQTESLATRIVCVFAIIGFGCCVDSFRGGRQLCGVAQCHSCVRAAQVHRKCSLLLEVTVSSLSSQKYTKHLKVELSLGFGCEGEGAIRGSPSGSLRQTWGL